MKPRKTKQESPGTPQVDGPAPVQLTLHGKRLPLIIFLCCVALEILFVFLDYKINYSRWTEIRPVRYMFSTTNEDGVASWFAMSQTLLAGMTLWMIVIVLRAQRAHWFRIVGWGLLAAFFTYMAFDDGVTFHERMGTTYAEVMRDTEEGPADFPSYYWQLLFLPFFGAMGLFMLVFLCVDILRSTNKQDWLSPVLVLTAIMLLIGAVAQDFVEGLSRDHDMNLYVWIIETFEIEDARTQELFKRNAFEAVRHFGKSLEECLLEALANSILWFVFMRYLTMIAADIRIRFKGREPVVAGRAS